MIKLKGQSRLYEALNRFKSLYIEQAGNWLSYTQLSHFPYFSELSEEEFYLMLKASGAISKLFAKDTPRLISAKRRMLSLRTPALSDLVATTISRSVVNMTVFWAKNLKQLFQITTRLMCRNKKAFPDICLALEMLMLFSCEIKAHSLESRFEIRPEISPQERVGGVMGQMLSYFIKD